MRQLESLVRRPAVAGRFYPGDPADLDRAVRAFLDGGKDGPPRPALGVMAPHAGYVYSGGVAGQVFSRVEVPARVVVLCPNHTGRGTPVSVVTEGAFRIPGADVPIDTDLARAILDEVPAARADRAAHRDEHAIEVELPFLLARRADVAIVPIVLSGLGEAETVRLGVGLYRAIARAGGDALLVASSDMSHYLPDAEAREVDARALEPLLSFDPAGLYRTVREHDISMCGFIPATAMLAYCREAGAGRPELVGYATSGDAFGDRDRVVGYAGVVVA
jgi:MEMO1 family protein